MRFLATLGVGFFVVSLAQADDCQFIRDQIKSASNQGAVIMVPAGVYICSASIVIDKNHITLKGEGQSRSLIKLKDQVHAPLLVVGNDKTVRDASGNYVPLHRVADIQVMDLTFDGNRKNHDVTKECGEEICEGNPYAIRNNGITIRGASRITLERVTTKSMISGGVVTEKYCDNLHVDGLTSYDNYFDGFAGYETTHSTFKNMNVSRNLGAGISIDINFNNNTIRDSLINQNGDVGIFMRHASRNRFFALQVLNSGNHGIFIAQSGAPQSCAEDNDFDTVAVKYSARSAFRLNDACLGNQVRGASDLCENQEAPISESHPGVLQVTSTVSCGA